MDNAIGEKIKQRRLALGMTQSELAEPEFSKSYLSYIERGKREVSQEAVRVFSRKLQVPPSFFSDGQVLDYEERFGMLANNALALLRTGQRDDAKPLLDEAWSLHSQIANKAHLVTYYQAVSSLYELQGDCYLALHNLLLGLQHVEDDPLQAWRMHYLAGRIFTQLNQLEQAQHHYEKALLYLSQNEELANSKLSIVYYALAYVLYRLQDCSAALRMYEKAAACSVKPTDEIRALTGLSIGHHRLGQLEEAHAIAQKAALLAETYQDQYLVAYTAALLGSILSDQGDYERAEHTLAAAEARSLQIADSNLHAEIKLKQGELLVSLGMPEEASSLFEALVSELEEKKCVTLNIHLIRAKLEYSKIKETSNPDLALKLVYETAAFARKTHHLGPAAEAYMVASRILEKQGNLKEALEAAKKAYCCSSKLLGGDDNGND